MPLSEHVYCVATPFKMAEWLEQWICNKFCIKVEHYSRNYYYDSEGCSYEKLVIGSFIMTAHSLIHHIRVQFFSKTSNYPGDSAPLQPRFGAVWPLALPQTKITFEREAISDCQWDSGKYDRAADINDRGELWGPKVSTLKGTEVSLSYVQCFLYLLCSSINVSIFQ